MKYQKLLAKLLVFAFFTTAFQSFSQTPLDGMPSQALAAYSVRLLSKTYKGPAMQIRRSSDSQMVDVFFDSSGQISLKSPVAQPEGNTSTKATLGTWVEKNSAFVTTWYDQSGNSNHAVQKVMAFQPRLVNEGALEVLKNGVATLKMLNGAIGGNGFNLPFNLSGVTNLNIFTVVKQEGNLTIGNHIFGSSGPTGKTPGKLQILYFNPTTFQMMSSLATRVAVGNEPELHSVRFKIAPDADGTAQITVGNKYSTVVNGFMTVPLDSSNTTLYRVGNALYSRNFEGISPEFLIYNIPLTNENATKLIVSQNSFFGSK